MREPFSVAGKRVLVTGAGTGIGRAIALEFGRAGADVVLHYSHSSDGADRAAEELRALGRIATAIHADFTNQGQIESLVPRAVDELGGLDVLVNNAGITMNLPIEKTTPEHFDRLVQVNLKAMYFLTRAGAPYLVESRGAVVNISSNHAFGGYLNYSLYAATKAAIVGFTRTVSIEMAVKGVRVNCIASGWVLVENQLAELPKDFDREKAALGLPAGFISDGSDIGYLAMFLASDAARYIIGQTICCDGGAGALSGTAGEFRNRHEPIWGTRYVPGLGAIDD